MDGLLQFLNRLGLARVAAMGVVAALMLGFFAFLVMRAASPQLAPIYTGLSLEDSSAIVTEIEGMGIPYELRGDGDTILIPRDQITTVRMALAGDGLPSRGQVGYEIFDQQSTLGATSFVQNINNVRALEGELARTITSLNRIKSARVHLVLPERELFQREKKDPSAAIVLAVRGELTQSEIRAIQHLVASSVEGMTPNKVSIVDDAGELLASGVGDDATVAQGENEERTLNIEGRMRSRIEDLLANVVGAGRARVEVSVELDLNRSTKTSETFNPDGQVVRSTQTRELANSATTPSQDGAVSVSNELPGATENNAAAGTSNEQQSTTEETTNYEISKTTETAVSEAGAVKRLSVAVVVDGVYAPDAQGNLVYAPRPQAELDQIKALVRSAIGFSEPRGDQLEIVNLQFAERGDANIGQGASAPGMFDFTRDDLINFAQMAVTLLIGLALVFFVLRPLLKRVLAPEAGLLPRPAGAAGAELDPASAELPGGAERKAVAGGQPLLEGAAGAGSGSGTAGWLNGAKELGEQQARTLKTVGTLVEDSPKQAALIVRDWLNSAA